MKPVTTVIDKLILLCRNLQKTSSIYCQALGLKMILQSPQLVELSDSKNLHLILLSINKPAHMTKGYSPILSFNVEYFDEIRQKLIRSELVQDGDVIQTPLGKIVNFQGPEGEHLSINNFKEENTQQQNKIDSSEDKSIQQIKNLLNKIKI